MSIHSIQDSNYSSLSSGGPVSQQDESGQFLTLLVTQMQNQDPLNPMSNAEFTSQLAQLSTLEQLQSMNDKFDENMLYMQSLNNTMMLGMVGEMAVVEGDQVDVTDGQAGINQIQTTAGGVATVTVRNEAGAVVATYTREIEAGWSDLSWDGLVDGQTAPDGEYTLSAVVEDRGGTPVESAVYMAGVVDSIRFEHNLALMSINGRDYYASEIAKVGI
jgi:flagellar basal-body rod modification protein FlgD